MNAPTSREIVPDNQPHRTSLNFEKHEPQSDDVKAQNNDHGWPSIFVCANVMLVEVVEDVPQSLAL